MWMRMLEFAPEEEAAACEYFNKGLFPKCRGKNDPYTCFACFFLKAAGIRFPSPQKKEPCGNPHANVPRGNPRMPRPLSSDLYPLLAAFLVAGVFCFSVRMMSRYLYPAIILLIYACILRPTKKRLLCTVAFSLAFFCNVWCDYMVYPYSAYHNGLFLPYIFSFYTVLCFLGLTYTIADEIVRDRTAA